MKKVYMKLMKNQGETLVEVIVSILICVISISLLMNGVAVSAKINQNADTNDEEFYKILSDAEKKQDQLPLAGKAIIKENARKIEIPIDLYGGEGIYSYEISE